ncbi:uncharacterized protein LOC143237334 isoform X2 [Tachypleus tridentatus]|uniref:uncharacterized protein LOC143237334 isoform X2 n=1 Tax=Tachypleus tridentatus TaxID=6853 RepID=UPI003FD475C6
MKMKHLHYQVKKLVPYKKDLSTNLKSGLVKEEQEDKYGVTEKTENIFVTMKTEQSDDLTQSEVISKFSKSTDDDLDSSKCGVINVKIETELQEDVQCVDSRLESTSGLKDVVCYEFLAKLHEVHPSYSFLIYQRKNKEETASHHHPPPTLGLLYFQ